MKWLPQSSSLANSIISYCFWCVHVLNLRSVLIADFKYIIQYYLRYSLLAFLMSSCSPCFLGPCNKLCIPKFHSSYFHHKNICCRNLFFFLFRAIPATHGSSWARGWIGAATEGCTTATTTPNPSHICDKTAVCGNTGSLTRWVRPGIERTSYVDTIWILNPLNHNRNSSVSTLSTQLIAYSAILCRR